MDAQPGVAAVQATSPVGHAASLRVAEKLGRQPVGTGHDDEAGEILILEIPRPGLSGPA